MRPYIALIASLLTGPALAIPVTVIGNVSWGYYLDNVQSATGFFYESDPYGHGSVAVEGATATNTWSHTDAARGTDTYATMSGRYSTLVLDDLFEFRVSVTAEAYASVSEDAIPGTRAYASARNYNGLLNAVFELHEEAQYLGTMQLYGVTYGDILAPGLYSSVLLSGFSVSAYAESTQPGYSEYTRSTRTSVARFAAVPVPEPSVVFLLGSGLLGVALARRKREH